MAIPIQSPLSYYLYEGERQHAERVRESLKTLTAGVVIDREENAKTVAKYQQYCADEIALSKKIRTRKRVRNWGIALLILAGLILSVTFGVMDVMDAVKSIFIVLSIATCVVLVCVLCKRTKKKATALQERLTEQQRLTATVYGQALLQMQDFNNAFPENVSLRLVEQTMPAIAFDAYFTAERLRQLQAYGFGGGIANDESVLETLSGELYGKPFLYDRRLIHSVGEKTYHGSLTIHWVTYSTDSEGNEVAHHHSQTLRASINRPYPYYEDETWLYYGSDVLPELCFSRTPKYSDDKSKRQLERELRKGERKLRRLEARELRKGGDFVAVENTDFEILFGATDRSDELDFREMYTMKAQENTLALLLSDATYGDDFHYVKQWKLHRLKSAHRQGRELFPSSDRFQSHDVTVAERSFLQLNERFYKDVFFDFAPILAVPVLQGVEDSQPIRAGKKTRFNYEEYVNAISDVLRPTGCDTACVLKVYDVQEQGDKALLRVVAYGYYGKPRIDYVPVFGGDGDWYDVPVPWVEFIPMQRQSLVEISTEKNGVAGQVRVAENVYANIYEG